MMYKFDVLSVDFLYVDRKKSISKWPGHGGPFFNDTHISSAANEPHKVRRVELRTENSR